MRGLPDKLHVLFIDALLPVGVVDTSEEQTVEPHLSEKIRLKSNSLHQNCVNPRTGGIVFLYPALLGRGAIYSPL